MESSSCQLFKESLQELSTEDASGLNCRLRSTLNEDCILKVLEFLNPHELLQMCRLDNYFEDLILKWIIGKKFINFPAMSKNCRIEIFKTFGKSLRKFVCFEADFKNLLLTIIRYCQPATLTEVYLNWKVSNLDKNIIQQAMPFFSNIRKLSLDCFYITSSEEFLNEIAMSATHLQILHLYNVDVTGEWLRTNQMESLCELLLHKARKISFVDLNIFLRNHTKIEVFSFTGNEDITATSDTLTKYCPNLRKFEDIHISYPQRHFATAMENRYDFLSTFSYLQSVTLTSYTYCGSDLHNVLKKLASRNIVKLKVVSELEHAIAFNESQRVRIMESSFVNFTSLQEFELNVRHFEQVGELHCDFIFHFVSQLKNLETLIFDCNRLNKVNKILDVMPTIRKLSIWNVTFQHLPVDIWKIVRKLREIRQIKDAENDPNLLHIIVNIEQYREFQVYKDIKDIATIEINLNEYIHSYRSNKLFC